MTLQEALQAATQQLAADPLLADSARRDAEMLLLHILDISRPALRSNPSQSLTTEQTLNYQTLIDRRLLHEPVQYIVGEQEFYGLPLRVSPAVLIPRPETEHLVEAVLERLPHDQPLVIADIGTGSGAITIALARHLPLAVFSALDLSQAALEVARDNATRLSVARRVQFAVSDLLGILSLDQRQNRFDAIVSNPPYVALVDSPAMHPQVREYEPATALFAGPDGLDIYKRLIPQAHEALKPGGLLALEIGHGQQAAIARLLSGWWNVEFVNDLQAIPRVALARK